MGRFAERLFGDQTVEGNTMQFSFKSPGQDAAAEERWGVCALVLAVTQEYGVVHELTERWLTPVLERFQKLPQKIAAKSQKVVPSPMEEDKVSERIIGRLKKIRCALGALKPEDRQPIHQLGFIDLAAGTHLAKVAEFIWNEIPVLGTQDSADTTIPYHILMGHCPNTDLRRSL